MIKKEINIPIYRGVLVMVLTDDLTDLNKEYGVNFSITTGGGVFNLTDPEGYTKYFVAFDKDWDDSIIVHESVHLVNDIFAKKCVALDTKNDEPQAYFTAWIYEECKKFLKKNSKKKKMEKEVWKYKVWIGSDCVLETIDKEEAVKTFNALPSGTGQPPSQRRGLTQEKTLLEDE